jgi:nitrate reductase (NAD(P)H)
MQKAGQDILKPSFSDVTVLPSTNTVAKRKTSEVLMTKPGVRRTISMAELRTQDKSNPWFVVKGEVYNETGFLDEHPGGAELIFISAGEDVTDDFMAIHSPEGKLKLAAVSTQ